MLFHSNPRGVTVQHDHRFDQKRQVGKTDLGSGGGGGMAHGQAEAVLGIPCRTGIAPPDLQETRGILFLRLPTDARDGPALPAGATVQRVRRLGFLHLADWPLRMNGCAARTVKRPIRHART